MERIDRKSTDFVLLLDLTLLIGLGIIALYSASSYYAEKLFKDPAYYLKKQIIWVFIGIFLVLLGSLTPKEMLKKLNPLILFASFVLVLMTFIPGLGRPVLGAKRWIFAFGMSFEPSELVKFSVVLYLSVILSKKQDKINDPLYSILPPLIVVSIFVGLIYMQNDFSTAFFILFVALSMFFIARVKLIYFVLLGTVIVPLGSLLLFTKEHRVKRLIAFLNPLSDPSGSGFQVIAAKTALINGGFWGRGLGLGVKKLGGLPEAHSDFIFAVICEETGFIGALIVITLFIIFAWRGYALAFKAQDDFGYYLAFGISTIIMFQALLNMAVVTGLVPATGIPLPFFSSGGSSFLMTMIMAGLLLNISRNING
ncbi:MAG: putative lipid II flippase FtsW [Spirochaetales bacterium]|nr:putative lipid II flippase FtsW [Spirochaetales bacterium]